VEITLGRGELPRVGRKDPCASRLTPPQAYPLRRKSHPGRCQHGLCDGSGVSPWVSSVLTLVFRDGAAEKVAGGAGVGHRVGVVDAAEDQARWSGSAPVARASARMRSRRMCSREMPRSCLPR